MEMLSGISGGDYLAYFVCFAIGVLLGNDRVRNIFVGYAKRQPTYRQDKIEIFEEPVPKRQQKVAQPIQQQQKVILKPKVQVKKPVMKPVIKQHAAKPKTVVKRSRNIDEGYN